jgi:hypothetical protein
MGDINNTHGGGAAAAGATFPVAMYVLSLMSMVKYACASVVLLSVIKLSRKWPNNLTKTIIALVHSNLEVASITASPWLLM